MTAETGVLVARTVGRYFPTAKPPTGAWAAILEWDDGNDPQFLPLEGRLSAEVATGHNVSGEVHAVLQALQEAKRIGLSVEIWAVNASVVKTIPEFYAGWKRNGWKKANGKIPSDLGLWQEIHALSQELNVVWHKRPKAKIDAVKEYEEFLSAIAERDNEFWMQRAIAKDPYG